MTNKDKGLEEILQEAIGEASMCWEPIPIGVFDSSNALKISSKLKGQILEWVRGKIPENIKCVLDQEYTKGYMRGYNQAISDIHKNLESKED